MIKFSEKNQAFYDMNLKYVDLPTDLVSVEDQEIYEKMWQKINDGYHVFKDFTLSTLRPSVYHKWDGNGWIDDRTDDQKKKDLQEKLSPLTRRQFRLIMVMSGYSLESIDTLISNIEDEKTRQLVKIEWDDSTTFERDNSSLILMSELLGLSSDQVDQMWLQALKL